MLTLLIIFGGIQRIARVSSIIVPVMALGYVGLALVIVALNHSFTGCYRTDCQPCFRLGAGIGRRSWYGINAGHQERTFQQ